MNKEVHIPVLVLIGPTAIGKTDLSLDLAETFGCEIISVDSMQVYRFMDIGTAKPSGMERDRVRHHLIDIVNPDEQYNAAHFVRDALHAIENISARGKIPLLTGGTGLYLKALLEGLFEIEDSESEIIRQSLYKRLEEKGRDVLFAELQAVDPQSAVRIHKNDTQRLVRALEVFRTTGKPWSYFLRSQNQAEVHFTNLLQLGLTCDRQMLYKRIEQRSHVMMENGLIAETENLLNLGYTPELPSMNAIGYKHANRYLAGIWDREETIRTLIRDTRRYAKRQMTWFRGNEAVKWHDRDNHQGVKAAIREWLSRID